MRVGDFASFGGNAAVFIRAKPVFISSFLHGPSSFNILIDAAFFKMI